MVHELPFTLNDPVVEPPLPPGGGCSSSSRVNDNTLHHGTDVNDAKVGDP